MNCPDKLGRFAESDSVRSPLNERTNPVGFYRALVENAGDILTILDRNGVMTYQSPAVREAMGALEDNLIGRNIFDLIHPDDRERTRAEIEECARTPGSVITSVFRLPHRNGSWRHMETRGRNLLDDPYVAGILCISRDLTETYHLKNQLREAEQLARFGQWRWIKGTPAPQWSRGVARILHMEEEDFPVDGSWYEKLIHPDDREELLSRILDAFETQEPVTCTTRFRGGDGNFRYIKTYAYAEMDAHDEIGALVGLAEDVSEEVEAEHALRASEAKYRLLTEQASDVVIHYAANGTVMFISPAVSSIVGWGQERFLGRPTAKDLIHPDDFPRAETAFIQCISDAIQTQCTYRHRHKDGHWVWLETKFRLVQGASKRTIPEVVGVTRDVSERKLHEMELLEARERAEAASHTKSRFLANMSHELRTPLNAIIGFSEILRMQMFGELGHPRYMEYAQLINESGALLLDLISDILDMSKIEAGKYDLHLETVNASTLIDSCARLIRGRAEENGIHLVKTVRYQSEDKLLADQRALKQILLNLLSNSVKFTPAGGQITIGMIEKEGIFHFSIQDTGRGIPQDQIERLGQPFEQIKTDAALAKEGTGLGLALVRSLTELHGGRMCIESEPGIGTKVTVSMPRVPYCALTTETEETEEKIRAVS